MVYTLRNWDRAEAFAGWLFDKRRAADLTQEELAEASGCTKGYVSQLERATDNTRTGKPARPSEDLVTKMAKALGVTLDDALLAAGYAPTDWQPVHAGRQQQDHVARQSQPTETRELHDDTREEYDRWYFAFQGDAAFEKLSPSEKDAIVRKAIEEDRRKQTFRPGDFWKAVEDAEQGRVQEE